MEVSFPVEDSQLKILTLTKIKSQKPCERRFNAVFNYIQTNFMIKNGSKDVKITLDVRRNCTKL